MCNLLRMRLLVTLLVTSPLLVRAQSGTSVASGAAMARDSAPAIGSAAATTAEKKKAAVRPDFKTLRFDESWPRVAAPRQWDDVIKAIPLAPHLALTLGGQVRAREEFADAFNLTTASDRFGLSRTLFHGDLQFGGAARGYLRVYGEYRDAQAQGRDLPGGTRPSDGDRSDVENLFGEVGIGRSFVRVGRQEVISGRERLIGVPDWVNNRRGFQGARAVLVRGKLSLDLLDARPMVVRQTAPNLPDSTTRFVAVTLGSAPGATPLAHGVPAIWQAYYYDQRITTASAIHRQTFGGRAAWTWAGTSKSSQSYGFESESAVQRGTDGTRLISAWFWTAEVQTQWRGVHGAPTLAFGVEEASGDGNATDTRLQSFNTLYPAAHAHGGYADVLGRPNARELHVISTWEPIRVVSLRASVHRFDRLNLADGIYNKQNTIFRAASGSTERHAGDEVDLTGSWSATRHLKMIFGHAWVQPGAFLRQTPGGAIAGRWGFLGTAFTF